MNTKNKQVHISNSHVVNNQRNPKPDKPVNDPHNYGLSILIQILILITAIASMSLFLSFIPVDFKYDYINTAEPIVCALSAEPTPSDNIYESEIPKPPAAELPVYDFSQPVPDSATYPPDYFSDAVFIGDSRTAGMIMYTKLPTINYSQVGLNVNLLSSKSYIRLTDENGEKFEATCMEALELEKGNYSSVYMSLGINELGWDANSFIKTYRKAVQQIQEIIDVPLYMQLIIPVTTETSENSTFGITNDKATQFNELLRSLAEELQVFLLNPTQLFVLDDGTLDPENSFDGVHLNTSAYKELLNYYQTHIVDPDDYENLRSTGLIGDEQ